MFDEYIGDLVRHIELATIEGDAPLARFLKNFHDLCRHSPVEVYGGLSSCLPDGRAVRIDGVSRAPGAVPRCILRGASRPAASRPAPRRDLAGMRRDLGRIAAVLADVGGRRPAPAPTRGFDEPDWQPVYDDAGNLLGYEDWSD